jgi:hypothetical protein
MAKMNLRVKYEGGQGVVRGLDPGDSLEKLISHSLESLGLPNANTGSLRMLTGLCQVEDSVFSVPQIFN